MEMLMEGEVSEVIQHEAQKLNNALIGDVAETLLNKEFLIKYTLSLIASGLFKLPEFHQSLLSGHLNTA